VSEFVDVDRSADPQALIGYLDLAVTGLVELKAQTMAALRVQPGQRILDVGCGVGHNLSALAALGACGVGIDSSQLMAAETRRRDRAMSALVADAAALPFRPAVFDGVLVERVLQHLADLPGAVAEIARVLMPGGRVAALEPEWASFRLAAGDETVTDAIAAAVPMAVRQPALADTLATLLAGQGFLDIQVWPDTLVSSVRDFWATDLRRAAQRAVDRGLVDAAAVTAWWAALEANDSDTAVTLTRLVFSATSAQ
jgi:SAM-dependent methyltransferase